MAEVLDVFLQHETLEALEGETELLVEGEALEGLEVFVHCTLHKLVNFCLEDLLDFQKEFPVADHQDRDVLSWERRLIEEDLERWAREPTLDLLPEGLERLMRSLTIEKRELIYMLGEILSRNYEAYKEIM